MWKPIHSSASDWSNWSHLIKMSAIVTIIQVIFFLAIQKQFGKGEFEW